MEQGPVFLKNLEKELQRVKLRSLEELNKTLKNRALFSEPEEPQSGSEQNPDLDSENEDCESPAEDPALSTEDEFEFVDYPEDENASQSEINNPELDDVEESNPIPATCTGEPSECHRIPDPAERSKENNGSLPHEVPAPDAERSNEQDSAALPTNGNESAAVQNNSLSAKCRHLKKKIKYEDIDWDRVSEKGGDLTDDECLYFLLPEEIKEIKAFKQELNLQSKLIETQAKELNSRLRREAEDHCNEIQRLAVEEIETYKRPSFQVSKEYHHSILMVAKYFEIQLDTVASHKSSALKGFNEDFDKNVKKVFDKVRERRKKEGKRRRERRVDFFNLAERPTHIHNPLVFYSTFVVIMTIYAMFIINILNNK